MRDVGRDSNPVGGRIPHASLFVMEEAAAQQGKAQSLQQDISSTLRIRYGKSFTKSTLNYEVLRRFTLNPL